MLPRSLLAACCVLALAACRSGPAARTGPAIASAPHSGAPADVNAPYRDPDLALDEWVERFESESREVAARRDAIVAALQLQPGERVADVGAGTGLFLEPLSRAVGPEGKVYAIDIAPRFLEHLERRIEAEGLHNAAVRAGEERSVPLPEGSIDLAFVCDTYHHFEHPLPILRSLHAALSPGGRLVLVDFERVPGQSREWVLDHVRAGKPAVIAEVESAGFVRLDEPDVGLQENWLVRFVRP